MANEVKESKAEAFVRIAPKRVDKILDAIKSLSTMASKNYEYTPEQVNKMFIAIADALSEARNKFDGVASEKKTGFNF